MSHENDEEEREMDNLGDPEKEADEVSAAPRTQSSGEGGSLKEPTERFKTVQGARKQFKDSGHGLKK